MKMTALEVVGALIAFAGTALVINTLFWLDGASSSASVAQLPSESVAKSRRTARRRAA
jgi:hypothetical protein